MKTSALLVLAPLLLFSCRGGAETLEPTLLQLNHRVFSAEEGVPTGISALAQTPDGTLWIGSRSGLMRFDGTRFVLYSGPSSTPMQQTNVASLLVTSDGSLWMSFRPHGVGVLKDGRYSHFGRNDGLPEGTVAQLAEDQDGSIWAAARSGLARFSGDEWNTVADEGELGLIYGVSIDREGSVWVASSKGLSTRKYGETHFTAADLRSYVSPRGLALATAPNGGVWAASRNELVAHAPGTPESVLKLEGVSGGPLLVDSDGDLWTADADKGDLLRVPVADLHSHDRNRRGAKTQRFTRADGLSPGPVYALLEDREHNVWVATGTALHRFNRSNVVREVAPSCSHYGQLNSRPTVAGDAGTLWVVCDNAAAPRVEQIEGGHVITRLASPIFTAAYRDPRGTVWFGGPDSLAYVDDGRLVVAATLPELVRGNPVQALWRDAAGAMWVSVTRMGSYRYHDGTWTENAGLDSLPSEPAYVAAAEHNGTLWLGYPENRVARVEGHRVEMLEASHGLAVGNVQAILTSNDTVFVGGELGLARWDGQRFSTIVGVGGFAFRGISGIVRSQDGTLWLNGIDGISRIEAGDIQRHLRDPASLVSFENFNYLDGVPGSAVQLRPLPSAIETTSGRIWFSMTAGIVSIDPARLIRNALPPPVTIWTLSIGAGRYDNLAAELQLPKHTTDLGIEYTAGSLTVPERVRFRYRLEGLDHAWHDAGDRREARYTNLGPGRYTFHVIASNNDGVWNNEGASISFRIAPAFYQTRSFYVACALACIALLAGLYRFRMRQVTARVRDRLKLRMAEREQIAQDLHDTLLQGVQGLIMKVHSTAQRVPDQDGTRSELEQTLDKAQQILIEARDRVTSLRLGRPSDLADDIESFGTELALGTDIEFRCEVVGDRRELHPLVREESFFIVREAMLNAFRHARATHIAMHVRFDRQALCIEIQDDGCGFAPEILESGGVKNHWGLAGMRERAARIRSTVRIGNRVEGGALVELRVPASVAYE